MKKKWEIKFNIKSRNEESDRVSYTQDEETFRDCLYECVRTMSNGGKYYFDLKKKLDHMNKKQMLSFINNEINKDPLYGEIKIEIDSTETEKNKGCIYCKIDHTKATIFPIVYLNEKDIDLCKLHYPDIFIPKTERRYGSDNDYFTRLGYKGYVRVLGGDTFCGFTSSYTYITVNYDIEKGAESWEVSKNVSECYGPTHHNVPLSQYEQEIIEEDYRQFLEYLQFINERKRED